MERELWALLGVIVGGLLTTIGQLVNARMQRGWADDDRIDQARIRTVERIFDHQRQAYERFLEQTTRLWREIQSAEEQLKVVDEHAVLALEPSLVLIQIYGSAEAYNAGVELWDALYAASLDNAPLPKDSEILTPDAATEAFIRAVRDDLEVPSTKTVEQREKR